MPEDKLHRWPRDRMGLHVERRAGMMTMAIIIIMIMVNNTSMILYFRIGHT